MKNLIYLSIFTFLTTAGCNNQQDAKTQLQEDEIAIELLHDTISITSIADADTMILLADTINFQEKEVIDIPEEKKDANRPIEKAAKPNTENGSPVVKENPVSADTVTKADKPEVTKAPEPGRTTYSYTATGAGNNVKVSGTSTLHDWEMDASTFNARGQFQFENGNTLTAIESFTFSLHAENLKGKDNKMNKNAWEALQTDKYKTIDYRLTSANITPAGNNKYNIKATGSLTVAGVTKEIPLDAALQLRPDNSIILTGTTVFNMTDFNVKPPVLFLGTLKTNDRITINYNFNMER